jgi:hypothetical protein
MSHISQLAQVPSRSDYLRETYHGDLLAALMRVGWLMDNAVTGSWARARNDIPDEGALN